METEQERVTEESLVQARGLSGNRQETICSIATPIGQALEQMIVFIIGDGDNGAC